MKKMASIIIIIAALILCLIGIIFISSNSKDDNKTVKRNGDSSIVKNTNEGIVKNQKFKDLDFTSTSISYVKGTGSTFKVKVTNNTDNTINVDSIDIILKDKDGNVITTLNTFLGGSIEPMQENLIKTTTKDDLTKAYSVEYKESGM